MGIHCKVLQGSHKERYVWERLEEVLCKKQTEEGSGGVVLLGRASPRVVVCVIQIANGSGDEQSMYEHDAIEASDEDNEMEKLPATMMKASFALGVLN